MGAPTHRQPVRPAEANRPDDRWDCASVGTNGPALEEPMSAREIIAPNHPDNIQAFAREIVRLHESGEKVRAKELGQQLPWYFEFIKANEYYSRFMKRRASIIRSISAARDPEDLAGDAMVKSLDYLRGSWGHALAVAEGCPPDQFWSHRAFLGSAKKFGERQIRDYRRYEWGEIRSGNQTLKGEAGPSDQPTEGKYGNKNPTSISTGEAGEGDERPGVDPPDRDQLSPPELAEIAETKAEIRSAVGRALDDLSVNDQFVVRQLLAWYADHNHLRGFYDVLLPALAAAGRPTSLVAARQQVSVAQMRLMGRIVASRRDALRAALVSIPAPTPERDPLTFTGRIAVSYLIEIAGKASWETTFARIRTHLKELEVDTIAPWNDASTAREALFDSFGAVATAYRERQGSSFWAATN